MIRRFEGVIVMDLESSVEKLDKYYARLDKGKVRKIKPDHVEKVIGKLKTKEAELIAEIEETRKESRVERLQHKLEVLREQQKRAQWLLGQISQT